MNIEELFRKTLKDAETMPPDDVWGELSHRLEGPAKAPVTTKARTGVWIAVSAVVVATIAAVALFAGKSETGTQQAKASVDNNEIVVASSQMPEQIAEQAIVTMPESVVITKTDESRKDEMRQERKYNEYTTAAEPMTDAAAWTEPQLQVESTPRTETASTDKSIQETAEVKKETVKKSEPVTKNEEVQTSLPQNQTMSHSDIDKVLLIPNLITPNGDDYNECWVIKGLDRFVQVQVQIFTAKSKQVFSASNYGNDFCGDNLPDGNYFYVIHIREQNYSRRGVLVIKR